jgi:hypothetical protein
VSKVEKILSLSLSASTQAPSMYFLSPDATFSATQRADKLHWVLLGIKARLQGSAVNCRQWGMTCAYGWTANVELRVGAERQRGHALVTFRLKPTNYAGQLALVAGS